MPAIEIRDVHACYRDGNQAVAALKGFSLDIRDGEFLCVLGRSGCGKSTLLRMLAGLDAPDAGTIQINGAPVSGPGADRMIVFQDYALFPWLTAEGNVTFALHRGKGVSKSAEQEQAMEMLKRVGMDGAAKRYPYQLSGGMRQRVAIARALAMDTDILLLDEPFGALDAKTRRELQELTLELWQSEKRKTVVFVTHDIEEALLLADRIVLMDDGRNREEITLAQRRPRTDVSQKKAELLQLFQEVGA